MCFFLLTCCRKCKWCEQNDQKGEKEGEAARRTVTAARCQAKLANLKLHIWITRRQVTRCGNSQLCCCTDVYGNKRWGHSYPLSLTSWASSSNWLSLSLCDDFMEGSEDAVKWRQSDVHELKPAECFMLPPLWGSITIWDGGEVSRPSWMDGPHWLRFLIISYSIQNLIRTPLWGVSYAYANIYNLAEATVLPNTSLYCLPHDRSVNQETGCWGKE